MVHNQPRQARLHVLYIFLADAERLLQWGCLLGRAGRLPVGRLAERLHVHFKAEARVRSRRDRVVVGPQEGCIQLVVGENGQEDLLPVRVERFVADAEVRLQVECLRQNADENFQRCDLRIDTELSPLRRLTALAFLNENKNSVRVKQLKTLCARMCSLSL